MTRGRVSRNVAGPASLLLVLLALTALVLDAASLPHAHAAWKAGLYNQEHDLSYLATFGASGPVPSSPSVAPVASVVLLAAVTVPGAPETTPRRHADFRAPPVR